MGTSRPLKDFAEKECVGFSVAAKCEESISSIVLSVDLSMNMKKIPLYRYFAPNFVADCRRVCGSEASGG